MTAIAESFEKPHPSQKFKKNGLSRVFIGAVVVGGLAIGAVVVAFVMDSVAPGSSTLIPQLETVVNGTKNFFMNYASTRDFASSMCQLDAISNVATKAQWTDLLQHLRDLASGSGNGIALDMRDFSTSVNKAAVEMLGNTDALSAKGCGLSKAATFVLGR